MEQWITFIGGIGGHPWITLAKISLAFVLGGVIGLERESKGKPVGFKTCVIIAVASGLMTDISIQSAEYYAGISENIRSDPMRLAAQIISGVGFLGAGVILHRSDDAISGLTTAAIIWASAGVGIACGASFYLHALLMTVLLLLAIKISSYLFMYQASHPLQGRVTVRLILMDKAALPLVMEQVQQGKTSLDTISVRDRKNHKIELVMKLMIRRGRSVDELYGMFSSIESVYAVAFEG